MDSLQDTIPFMISDLKQDLERDRNLTYPFNRLSLVEVPANFSSCSRLWTKAQETVQPEMIFIPEGGYAIDAADINWSIRMAQNNQRAGGGGPMGGPGGRGGRGGNQTRTLYDFKYDALNSFFRSFLNQQLRPQWSMAAGGNANISVSDNPYCIFPELFNFRLNIYSPELPVPNRLVDQYIYPVTGCG